MHAGPQIRNICVIGAGTMGGGIAAHLANLGFRPTLIDLDALRLGAGIDRIRSAKPPALYLAERISDISLVTLEEADQALGLADWVIEAVAEDLEVKRRLYGQIAKWLKPTAFLTTNTSGLPIAELATSLPVALRGRFLGTHFFNPPRYLKLLEVVPGAETDASATAAMVAFAEGFLGKRAVIARDTPGFIANRYGIACLFHAIHVAEKLQLSVEQVDAITGSFLGRPSSGTFRLADLIGIDVLRDIASGLTQRGQGDPFLAAFRPPDSLTTLLSREWLGEKTGHGYTRKQGKELFALDLTTFAYRPLIEVQLPTLTELGGTPLEQRVREALRRRDEVGEFLREYLVPTLQYAEYLRTRIADDVRDIDRVMRWGFGWTQGPFELVEAIGASNLGISQAKYYSGGQVLAGQAWTSPPPEPQFAPLSDYAVIEEGATVRRRDLGDGVHSLGITTKSGVLTPTAVAEISEILTRYPDQRFVLTSEGSSFSVGFDLTYFLERIESDALAEIDQALIALQSLGELLERSRVVAAVRSYCLGGGLELALSCPILIADAEAKIGLPEAKVGLIPAGRGTTLCRLNNQASKWLPEVAVSLAKGEVSANADHAHRLGYLRPQDQTSYHPDRLIWDAKNLARTVEPVTRPNWNPLVGPVAGKIEQGLGQAKRLGHLSDYDEKIGERIKHVMTKAPTYEAALARERHEFLDLCTKALTQARIRHMIQHRTPLRN